MGRDGPLFRRSRVGLHSEPRSATAPQFVSCRADRTSASIPSVRCIRPHPPHVGRDRKVVSYPLIAYAAHVPPCPRAVRRQQEMDTLRRSQNAGSGDSSRAMAASLANVAHPQPPCDFDTVQIELKRSSRSSRAAFGAVMTTVSPFPSSFNSNLRNAQHSCSRRIMSRTRAWTRRSKVSIS